MLVVLGRELGLKLEVAVKDLVPKSQLRKQMFKMANLKLMLDQVSFKFAGLPTPTLTPTLDARSGAGSQP